MANVQVEGAQNVVKEATGAGGKGKEIQVDSTQAETATLKPSCSGIAGKGDNSGYGLRSSMPGNSFSSTGYNTVGVSGDSMQGRKLITPLDRAKSL